ncbi:nucleotidyltransferase domain-containing protein [Synechococcus sp. UW140]|uniref:nucleotidyltransferase domain-containing protein n=1 Tax=Synechococcus sp. UW140 TaxID=368503 RepID=UPI0025CE9FC0|nr:nucleotidyltransferase domain-containing protein [Synechococcus sp. UW140]
MTTKKITIGENLNVVTAALMEAQMLPLNIFLFGSRARGDARPDSDIDLLVIVQQATLSPLERQQVLRSLRAALRPLQLQLEVDLVVVGKQDAQRLASSRWHVVARALREGTQLNVAH